MKEVGRQKLVDKTIKPLEVGALQTVGPFTVTEALRQRLGVYLLGGYKGQTVFVDLDKLVNEPLVKAELEHILGILDGREEDYDLQTIIPAVGDPIGTAYAQTLTVPSGQVWYINAVRTILNTTGAAQGLVGNWRCSLWPDRSATPNEAGQSFHPAAGLVQAPGGTTTWLDEFGPIATVWEITNKVP
ncbi:MAG: hypothetical protein PHU23_14125, partial [Dehalococcoidales bacterium]|nr:hypothetical protein [Dehalococcoidales bacterium]